MSNIGMRLQAPRIDLEAFLKQEWWWIVLLDTNGAEGTKRQQIAPRQEKVDFLIDSSLYLGGIRVFDEKGKAIASGPINEGARAALYANAGDVVHCDLTWHL